MSNFLIFISMIYMIIIFFVPMCNLYRIPDSTPFWMILLGGIVWFFLILSSVFFFAGACGYHYHVTGESCDGER